MTPPKKCTGFNIVGSINSRELINKYLNTYDDPGPSQLNGPLEEADHSQQTEQTITTYYVDQDGQYYYKPSPDCDELVELEDPFVDTKIVETPQEVHVDGGTMALVKSEGGSGNINYFMLLPDDIQAQQSDQTLSIVNKQLASDSLTVYDFEDTEHGADHNEDGTELDEEDDIVTAIFMGKSFKTPKRARLSEYKCEVCVYTSPRKYLLQRHMKCHSDQRPFVCKVCERGFKTPMSLKNHLNTHKGVKPHVCTYCDSAFTTSGELVRHVRYKHTHDKPHKCSECEYASVELSKLRRHMRCHTGERPYQCPQCTYASSDTFKLKRHLRTHTGEKPYKCDECNMTFTQSNSLKTHKLIHNYQEKPSYQCDLCPTTCGRKTDLRLHVQKLHTPIKSLKCTRCSKLLPDRYSFKLHNKSHDGEKCYKCALCPYASTTLRHLKCHLLKHTDEKPFVCDHCDQSFRQKQLLRRHENLYHNPSYVPSAPKLKCHACHECKREFAHKGNLIRHMATHDSDRHRDLPVNTDTAVPGSVTSKRSSEILEAFEEEEEEYDVKDDDSTSVKLTLGTCDTNLGKLVTISEPDDQLVVYQVVEDGVHTRIHLVDSQQADSDDIAARALNTVMLNSTHGQRSFITATSATVTTHNHDTSGTTHRTHDYNDCFGFDVSE